ncbi:hypothetical protein GCM10010435_69300 [Winogradskya consettensis]|uniref:Uncharacterized protein n=1 Tax=Winogradskya consettensis TaxID=113560 RepID=A0A919SIR5_9ACTN|nr:DUF5995 family protein [Actinoplanes consettensis]GIM73485.1 hypothetical protein Aco04nite_35480 [Actinoplanes consettensis]
MTATVAFDINTVRSSADLLRTERIRIAPDEPGLVPSGRGWGEAKREMAELCAVPPATIAEVLEMLTRAQRIMDLLPPPAANRIASFNSLYFTITDRVGAALTGPDVVDPEFLELLDVEFAKRYFDALRLWGEEDHSTPDAWEVLFRRAQDEKISRLAAAILGVNAHINHDLALALVATWERLGTPPGDVVHPDYLLINKIFYQEIPRLRRRYSTSWQLRVDMLAGDLDDWSQSVLVAATRAHAWDQGRRLWDLRDEAEHLAHARLVMDRASAYVGELLITSDGVFNQVGVVLKAGRDGARGAWRRVFHKRRAGI